MTQVERFLYITGSILIAISLPTSRGFITVGIVILAFASLLRFYDFHQMKFTTQWFTDLWRNRVAQPFLVLTLPFILLLVSGFYSTEAQYWLVDLRIGLAAIFLPIAALSCRKMNSRFLLLLQVLFLLSCLVSSTYTLTLYARNYESLTESLSKGQHLPTFLSPIRFSLMLSFAFIIALGLFFKKETLHFQWERYLYLSLAIFFLFFLHVMAIRSGIIAAYFSLLFLLIYSMIKKFRNYHLIAIIMGILFPILSYQIFPSFKAKIDYMLYDWRQYKALDASSYSDSGRLQALEMGWEIFTRSPIIGHGSGSIRGLMNEQYVEYYPHAEKRLLPHNYFLLIAMKTGILGLLIFLFSLFYPLFGKRWKVNLLFPLFTLQILLSCLVENTMDSSIGNSYYLFWTCLFLLQWKNKIPISNKTFAEAKNSG